MKSRAFQITIHLLFCLAFLALPYIFAPHGFPGPDELSHNPHERTNLISYLLMIGFFYLNYYFLIPKLYFQRHYVLFVAGLLGSFAVIALMLLLADRQDLLAFRPENGGFPEPPGGRRKPPVGFELSHTLFLFLVGVFVSLSLRISNRLKQAEREKLNTELAYLKAQINPHFLFNTLNSIYSLAIEKSDETADAIVRLSSLMRYVIKDVNNNQVPLTKELDYISHYVALQQLRLDDTVAVAFSVRGKSDGFQIAPLILISFIENAFKYGVNPQETSDIRIAIEIRNHNFHLYVFNKKVRRFYDDEASSGIGIENTRARLQLLYPDRHRLVINDEVDDFIVDLTITLA